MAELLRDNMELGRRHHLEAGLGGGTRPSRREVPDLLSWIACFGVYASMVAQKCPNRVRELWAYQTMVVHEARRCGGKGWQIYDSMFRQQAANNPKVDWSVLNTSTSFLAMQNQGMPALHGDGPRLAGLYSGPYSPQQDRPGSRVNTENKEGSPGKNQGYGEPASIGTRGSAICHTVASSTCVSSVEATTEITSAGGPSTKDPPSPGRPRGAGRDFTA